MFAQLIDERDGKSKKKLNPRKRKMNIVSQNITGIN